MTKWLFSARFTSPRMPEDQQQQNKSQSSADQVSFKALLEKVPPGRTVSVESLAIQRSTSVGAIYYPLQLPVLELHCERDSCSGVRLFEPVTTEYGPQVDLGKWKDVFVLYRCRNCRMTMKTYALGVVCEKDSPRSFDLSGKVYKYGEHPAFGSPTPARVITLLGPEKEYYLKGRRAENQGMGVAAFAYYRRVVENQKNRLLDEIIRVAEKIGASPEMLADLNEAQNETQFTAAVRAVKHGIPSALLLNGHNPLTLLHAALSEGLHAQSDEECLALATSIRIVLADLADRLGHALKDRAELDAAVTKLMR
jgi:hypothetical protein